MSLAVANRPEQPHAVERLVPPSRYDRAWMALIGGTDAVLRRIYGVETFCDNPDCLLRIGRAASAHALTLGDGTAVQPGAPIALLHFWNEHIPGFPASGPDLAWAKVFRYRMNYSLRALSLHLAEHRDWDDVQAIHGCVNFGSRRRRWQIRLAAARFGFELLPVDVRCGLHERGEDLLIWCFARAFNKAALPRHVLWRDRTELWTSRASLRRRYG